MTRDEIIRMAREAGEAEGLETVIFHPVLERFATLVTEAEREACAKVCEDKNTLLRWPTYAAAIRARGEKK